jgi:hypothetical protein
MGERSVESNGTFLCLPPPELLEGICYSLLHSLLILINKKCEEKGREKKGGKRKEEKRKEGKGIRKKQAILLHRPYMFLIIAKLQIY